MLVLESCSLQLYQKGNSGTGVSLYLFRSFPKHLFKEKLPGDRFYTYLVSTIIFCHRQNSKSSPDNESHVTKKYPLTTLTSYIWDMEQSIQEWTK